MFNEHQNWILRHYTKKIEISIENGRNRKKISKFLCPTDYDWLASDSNFQCVGEKSPKFFSRSIENRLVINFLYENCSSKKLHEFFTSPIQTSRKTDFRLGTQIFIENFAIFDPKFQNFSQITWKSGFTVKKFHRIIKISFHSQNQFFTTFEEKSKFWIENDKIAHIREIFFVWEFHHFRSKISNFFSNDVKIWFYYLLKFWLKLSPNYQNFTIKTSFYDIWEKIEILDRKW